MKKLTLFFIALLCYMYGLATPGIFVYDATATSDYSLDVSDRNSNDEVTVTFKLNKLNVAENSRQPGKELIIINGVYTALLVVNNKVCDSINILVK